jgi:hypothetical protein
MHTLVREIEIIGEAASKLSPKAREQIPDIEWRKVIGMRNRLIHASYDINLDQSGYSMDYCNLQYPRTHRGTGNFTISTIAEWKRQRDLTKRGFPMGRLLSIQREELHRRNQSLRLER